MTLVRAAIVSISLRPGTGVVREAALSLGKMLLLVAALAPVAVEAHAVVACEYKRAQRTAAETMARKPAKVVDNERVRIERREPVYSLPVFSRRVILQ